MVTIIHKDVDKEYLNLDDWIKRGITTDAICLVGNRWCEKSGFGYYSIFVIRNTDYYYFLAIKPLNKW